MENCSSLFFGTLKVGLCANLRVGKIESLREVPIAASARARRWWAKIFTSPIGFAPIHTRAQPADPEIWKAIREPALVPRIEQIFG